MSKTESLSVLSAFVEKLEDLLQQRSFVTTAEMVELGLFGTTAAALAEIKNGRLPAVKVSPHRFLVPRSALLDFVQANIFKEETARAKKKKPCASL